MVSKWILCLTLSALQIASILGITWQSTPYWQDDFSGPTLDSTKWTNGRKASTTKHAQHYKNDSIQFDNDGYIT